jgi:hypothetical protein
MLQRSVLVRAALVAGVLSLGLAGCGQLRPSQKIEIFEAALSGSQEVPPVASSGNGTAELHYNENTNMLRWRVSYGGLSGPVTGAHIHGPAAPGQNAGVIIPFTGNLNASPITGEARITQEQLAQLMTGQWYVNLHTPVHPQGEIRGQLRQRRN